MGPGNVLGSFWVVFVGQQTPAQRKRNGNVDGDVVGDVTGA